MCKLCGSSRVVCQSVFLVQKGYCGSCLQRGQPHTRKMDIEQVSLLKSLLSSWVKDKRDCAILTRLTTYAGWFQVSVQVVYLIKLGKHYKEIEPMAKAEVWKALLKQHDVLLKKAGVTLYERGTFLAKEK